MILTKERLEGGTLPPWYYGHSYTDFCRHADIFYAIPLNYLVRWIKNVKYLWDKFRSKRGWMDKQILAVRAEVIGSYYNIIERKIEERAQALSDQRLKDAINEIDKEVES